MADRAEPEDLQRRAANASAATEPARVFVSYASPDAAVAGALVEALEEHGIACWIAPRDVKAGALYADSIVRHQRCQGLRASAVGKCCRFPTRRQRGRASFLQEASDYCIANRCG